MKTYRTRTNHAPSTDPDAGHRISGIVQQVDLVSRELAVHLPTGPELFDVPVDCDVVLHGERIKLRLVQPGDVVAITFTRKQNLLVARQLEVQPDMPMSKRA